MKINILTFQFAKNYGAILQAHALSSYIKMICMKNVKSFSIGQIVVKLLGKCIIEYQICVYYFAISMCFSI